MHLEARMGALRGADVCIWRRGFHHPEGVTPPRGEGREGVTSPCGEEREGEGVGNRNGQGNGQGSVGVLRKDKEHV